MMPKKLVLSGIACILLLALAAVSLQLNPQLVYADGGTVTADNGFTVEVIVTGTIRSLTDTDLSLADGSVIQFDPTTLIPVPLAVGEMVTITATLQNDMLLGRTIVQGTVAATLLPTLPTIILPTAQPLVAILVATPTQMAVCQTNTTQPVAARLAAAFNVTYSEIMGWFCQGFGFGEIARAYLLARLSNTSGQTVLTPAQIFALRRSEGWGEVIKTVGISPSLLAPGQVIRITVSDNGDDDFQIDNDPPRSNKPAKKPAKPDDNSGDKGKGKGDGKGDHGKGNSD